MISQILTGGEFATEFDAWAHFDRVLEKSKAFAIHKEVVGEYIHPRPNTDAKSARVDRILIPKLPALKAGWHFGAIVVEGKKSDTKVGKLIAQAMDYTRCVFTLSTGVPGLMLMSQWVFVYPLDRITGDIESIMAQNRIGYVTPHRDIGFYCGGMCGLRVCESGAVEVKPFPMGSKRGNRG